jgi:hypothetical protein
MRATGVVPTFNVASNVAELVGWLSMGLAGQCVEVLFVDDSTDDTRSGSPRSPPQACYRWLIHRSCEQCTATSSSSWTVPSSIHRSLLPSLSPSAKPAL